MLRDDALFVGWVRSGFRHWEPVTLPARELVEAARLLHHFQSFDFRDGSKVLLPEGVRPVERPSCKSSGPSSPPTP